MFRACAYGAEGRIKALYWYVTRVSGGGKGGLKRWDFACRVRVHCRSCVQHGFHTMDVSPLTDDIAAHVYSTKICVDMCYD